MKRWSICLVAVMILVFMTQGSAFADKTSPLLLYDFNTQSVENVTETMSQPSYFKKTVESNIGGKNADDYAYKIFANQHGAQSGSQNCTVTIPIPQTDAEIITTEFDLYDNLTANPDAKQAQAPSLLVYSSATNVLWITQNYIQSVPENWKKVLQNSDAGYFGSWSKITLSVNRTQKSFSAWLNDTQLCADVLLGDVYEDQSLLKLAISYWYDAPGKDCFFAVDNIRCYEGARQPDDRIIWKTEAGEIHSLSELKVGDRLSASLETYNYSESEKSVTAVLLVRNASRLQSAKSKKISVPLQTDSTLVESDAVEITDIENLEVQYVLLDCWENRIPLCDAYSLK